MTEKKFDCTFYINRDGQGYRETVEEIQGRKPAFELANEYRKADVSAYYWVSRRPCKGWN